MFKSESSLTVVKLTTNGIIFIVLLCIIVQFDSPLKHGHQWLKSVGRRRERMAAVMWWWCREHVRWWRRAPVKFDLAKTDDIWFLGWLDRNSFQTWLHAWSRRRGYWPMTFDVWKVRSFTTTILCSYCALYCVRIYRWAKSLEINLGQWVWDRLSLEQLSKT